MEARFADPVACLAVARAGVVHDFAHPGTTNPHEVKTSSEAQGFWGCGDIGKVSCKARLRADAKIQRLNILAPLTMRAMRESTTNHRQGRPSHGSRRAYDVRRTTERNGDARGRAVARHAGQLEQGARDVAVPGSREVQLRDLVAAVALKFADLGHACKKRVLHEEWTARITNEFWTLGEREQSLNVAVSPLCDRHTDVDVAKSP